MDWGWDMPDQDPTFSPLSMVHVPFQVECISTGPAYSRTMGFSGEVIYPSQWDIPLQIPVDNTFPGVMGLGVLSSTPC